MDETRRSLNRIDRLVEVREAYVTAAEAAVRETEGILRYFEEESARNAGQIQQAREEIAYLTSSTGTDLQARERHIHSLNLKSRQIAQDVEKAKQVLEKRRGEWREAKQAKKVVERVQERRLQEWERSVDVKDQKQVDEISIGKHARDQLYSANSSASRDSGTAR